MDRKTQNYQGINFPPYLIYTDSTQLQTKILASYFVDTDKLILKFKAPNGLVNIVN